VLENRCRGKKSASSASAASVLGVEILTEAVAPSGQGYFRGDASSELHASIISTQKNLSFIMIVLN
jgi:hypothetical protein